MSLPTFFKEPHSLSGLPEDSPILIGLSGGADSSALLHLLCEYRRTANCKIYAAHLNHGIRTVGYGDEAMRDEAFCKELCKGLGVELFIKRLDIPSMAKKSGNSIETEARNARYCFFAEIMREDRIKILATAHNADDNLETQISNLARGCGIDGMIGIPETRRFNDVGGAVIIRPILRAQKSDILEYCSFNGIDHVTDSTNSEDECTRNIIRHHIVPSLESLFPAVRLSAARLSESAAEDSDCLYTEARKWLALHSGALPISGLKKLHPSIKKRVIMLSFEAASGARLENIHISDMISLLESKKNGAAISLPAKMRARVIDGHLHFENDTDDRLENTSYDQKLNIGFNIIESTDFAINIGIETDSDIHCRYTLYARADIKKQNTALLHARNRFEGACILDGGVNKKIKKLMCDKKVPLLDRATLPIIMSGNDAVYLPLCAVSDASKAKGEGDILHISIFKKTDGGKNEK